MLTYRPWGSLHWILSKINNTVPWTFCACISPEERSLGAFFEIRNCGFLTKNHFVIVNDPPSKYTNVISNAISENCSIITSLPGNHIITHFPLLYHDLNSIYDYINLLISESQNGLILDISCFPKRFFFPLTRFLYTSDIKNLIVVNTSPEFYRAGPLAENYSQWSTLPFFSDLEEEIKKDVVLFGVGHMPMASLGPIQDICASSHLHLFFPFPGHASSFKHTWNSVHKIKLLFRNQDNIDMTHINASDTSEMYDTLVAKTSNGTYSAIVAPYGPKPFSLAMAIYATKYNAPVFYTQPQLYHPDYSTGTAKRNGRTHSTAYSLILNGRRLY